VPDIFDEVAEDLRAERLRQMLRRYGGALVLAAVLVVVGAGSFEAWRWYDGRQTGTTAQSFMAATSLADGGPKTDPQRAAALFADVAAHGNASYRTLALLREAGLKDRAGDVAAASALWEQVAHDGGADRMLRDFASLQWATANVDSGDTGAVSAHLQTLTAPDNAWHSMALEMQALLALRQNQPESARDTLRRLAADGAAPQGVRQQATNLLAQLGPNKASGS